MPTTPMPPHHHRPPHHHHHAYPPQTLQPHIQHEAVSSAVADSVILLNSTLYERLNVTLEGLASHLASIQALGAKGGGSNGGSGARRPGQRAVQMGLRAKHPVVIVPGVWLS